MGIKTRLLTYAVVAIVAYQMGSCSAHTDFRKEQLNNPQPALYSITGEIIEDFSYPLYCINEQIFENIRTKGIEALLP